MSLQSLSLRPSAIEFRLVPQGFLGDLADERFVILGDHYHPVFADGVTPAILLVVVADAGRPRDEDVAIDDCPADLRVAAHANTRHQDALLDLAEAVHAD